MNSAELNRLGILLNFAAGFLLAPELIGIQRIRKLESLLEEKSMEIRRVLEEKRTVVKATSTERLLQYKNVTNPLSKAIDKRLSRMSIAEEISKILSGEWARVLFSSGLIVLSMTVLSWIPNLKILPWALYLKIIDVIAWFPQVVARQLEKEDALRSVIVVVGIAFFVSGNALQLWATF